MDSSVDVDEYATYDVSTCNSNFHPGIISLWMKGLDCVNIYPASDCTGWFIRLTLLGFPHYWLNTYRWIGEEMIKENLQIGSAGPCFDKCDARNWQGDRIEAVHVTLYDKTEFRGNPTPFHVDHDGCILIPPSIQNVYSMKINGDENACIDLHSLPNCGGKSIQFRPGYPNLENLFSWGLTRYNIQGVEWHPRAISRCGEFCNKSLPLPEVDVVMETEGPLMATEGPDLEIKGPNMETYPLGSNIVTLYDRHGNCSHSDTFNLTYGCITLDDYNPENPFIQTNGHCVLLYGMTNCVADYGFYVVQGSRNHSFQIPLSPPFYPKSIQLCYQVPPQEEEKECGKGGLNPVNNPLLPIWALILIGLVAIFLLMLTAVGGAYISKRY
ncbi:hypothetical protein Fcan01_23701 [Folsomia candida]|uniref:Uncharacterized protein n=2 Tax=Folsomia candida TaxID=158441 RepID=A0A226D9B5_FOLCA|nr:hypothetical protein Fcan01_23701 [Folsomia candida]